MSTRKLTQKDQDDAMQERLRIIAANAPFITPSVAAALCYLRIGAQMLTGAGVGIEDVKQEVETGVGDYLRAPAELRKEYEEPLRRADQEGTKVKEVEDLEQLFRLGDLPSN